MKTITTQLHRYRFDLRKPDEFAAWKELKAELAGPPHCMECWGGGLHYDTAKEDGPVTLETKHLFGNQWNEAGSEGKQGRRLFDWALDYMPYHNANLKQGYYLDQTDEMRTWRHTRYACGYCGKQVDAALNRPPLFCSACLDSAYLKESDLFMLRMRAIDAPIEQDRPPLTDEERAHLVPLYTAAQTTGTTSRKVQRMAKLRADAISRRDRETAAAKDECGGILWLLDHGIDPDNCTYYKHTGRFGFGWRTPVSAAVKSKLLDVLVEFPYDYDIVAEGDKAAA